MLRLPSCLSQCFPINWLTLRSCEKWSNWTMKYICLQWICCLLSSWSSLIPSATCNSFRTNPRILSPSLFLFWWHEQRSLAPCQLESTFDRLKSTASLSLSLHGSLSLFQASLLCLSLSVLSYISSPPFDRSINSSPHFLQNSICLLKKCDKSRDGRKKLAL